METIEIKVSEYYNNSKYYPFMPEVVFDALEKSFVDGLETATVSKSAFDEMKKFEELGWKSV
ncbi:MAG: hypothetical protein EZS26_000789 [Candidatus Ordinivivax streblomastigis]|uniref:Uncharacterized protein n=1 Tax=Candidatus Ordinivivax streblomastigis TaxID=2540710 RepID=A0A5M8P4D1_9BACT|nr:MAG: hypothetical protein EZS26_000789 [Candidatus Ordinivivax streblomastigis]